MKNYEKYETPERRISAFLEKRGHPLLTESPDAQLHHFAEWLEEEVPNYIRPCLHCGGSAKVVEINDFFHVKCIRCGARSAEFHKDKIAAIKNWNRRTKE